MTAHNQDPGFNPLRMVRGLGAQGFTQAAQILIRLAEVPLFLYACGADFYGEWLMIAAVPAYFSLADGGFAGAACREMSMRSSAGDRAGALSVFQSTWVLLLAVSSVVFLFGAALINALDFTAWSIFRAIGSDELKTVSYLFMVDVLLVFQQTLLIGGFWSTRRYPLYMMLSAMTQILEFIGLALALLLGGGASQAAAGMVGGRLFGIATIAVAHRRICPWLSYGIEHFSLKELQRLLKPALASLAFPLGNAFNIQGMRLIVGIILGPPAVASFTTLRTLSRLAMQPRVIVNQITEPELSLAFGNGDSRLLSRIFTVSCQVAFWVCLAVCVALALTSEWLYPLWTVHHVQIHWPLYLLLLCTAAANSLWGTALTLPYATNRHSSIALVYLFVYGIAAFLLASIGLKSLGFAGIGIALLASELAMTVYTVNVALRLNRQQFGEWLNIVVRPPVFLVPRLYSIFRSCKTDGS